jgi:hypothetical protein
LGFGEVVYVLVLVEGKVMGYDPTLYRNRRDNRGRFNRSDEQSTWTVGTAGSVEGGASEAVVGIGYEKPKSSS